MCPIDDYAPGATARSGDSPVQYRPPMRLQGSLAPGAVIANLGTNGRVVNVLGSGRIRIVAKYGQAGNLVAKWRLADHLTDQTVSPIAPVALVANTENLLDIANNPGYGELEISIVDTGGGAAVAYVDVFMTNVGN